VAIPGGVLLLEFELFFALLEEAADRGDPCFPVIVVIVVREVAGRIDAVNDLPVYVALQQSDQLSLGTMDAGFSSEGVELVEELVDCVPALREMFDGITRSASRGPIEEGVIEVPDEVLVGPQVGGVDSSVDVIGGPGGSGADPHVREGDEDLLVFINDSLSSKEDGELSNEVLILARGSIEGIRGVESYAGGWYDHGRGWRWRELTWVSWRRWLLSLWYRGLLRWGLLESWLEMGIVFVVHVDLGGNDLRLRWWWW
jgi:hypothetical protein